ncbi:PREDICTED: kinesin-related protein 4-like [Eufriesea mexicana]|uniref:kinesin-related protein 4-like n=1 Tax=Eufriesea mexicana TaxID=516756 RepID=UPI00083BC974|nr:PREDICTED: kinesin-related protein 4-like [Eufriesea mexicana]
MSDSIKVAIKVRPFIKREKDDNLAIQWVVQENSIISTDPEMKKRGDGGFVFDHIFDMNASNSDVFNTVVKPIVNAAVNGINGTVFAYGQTSSGKTYTMMGIEEEPGIVPLAVQHMFDAIANTTGREFLLRVSYLEIYNERVNDLLNKSGTDLKIKEDGSGQVVLQCKEEITNSPENVLSIMKKGDKKRRIGETNMNERSSRSHTIFRITVESREAGGDSDSAIQVSQLNLVDLAGSERARQTGATGERFKEGRHINLSLSTLSLVIMQLSESQDGQKHVNFRDSKLTRLLQSSLGGNAMTAIICAVTPAALEETQCTLSFASRAKSVRNKPQINEVMSDAALLKRYAKQLSKLQEELQRIKNENRSAEVEEMESKLQEKERINQLLEERIELLKTRILSGDNISQEDLIKRKSKRRQTWGGPGIFNQHLSTFQSKSGLPTINEVSFEKPQRKSIIQPMDIMNQTFQTAFADFELELFESERDRESRETISDSDEELFITKHKNRVTFRDDVSIRSKNNSFDVTPEKCNMFTQTIDYQASPSTPKHVLRQCITDLTREFVQLREFTTLEKQLICQENHCHAQEGEEYSPETDLKQTEQIKSISKYKGEYIPEVKEQLANLNLAEEKNLVRIITELCIKLNEVQKQNISEEELRLKTMKQFSELEKKIENITSERNEYEYMSCELRAELKKRTAELELKIMSEENTKQEEMKKISGIEKQIETTISKKNEFERINAELTKKFTELQKQIENVTSERNEFEHMHRELRMELNKKSIELERFSNNSENANIELVNNKIIELETKVENITYEKDKFKQMNDDLRVELKCISSEFESKITSKQTEKQNAIEKVSELEKYIEQILSSKNELEQDNIEIKSKLDNKIIDLESKIEFEQILNQKVLEFEKQIEKIISDKNEIECMNRELNKNILGLKSTILSQQTIYQEANDKISDLEQKLENAVSEKNEFQRVNIDLHTTLNKKCSDLEEKIISKETENLQALEKISEFEKQIMNITSEKKELERINNELRIEMEQKVSEQEEKIIAAQNENQKIIEKISDLKTQIESETLEKDKYERTNIELRSQLNAKISDLDSYIISNETNNQNTMEKISQLENQVTSLTFEKDELKHTNNELRAENNELRAELKAKVAEQIEYQNATEKICELKKQISNTIPEKNELCYINKELCARLIKKTSALKTKIQSEEIDNQKVMEMITELEVEVENITSTRDDIEYIITELRVELDKRDNTLESERIENQKLITEVSELNKQIEYVKSERNKFEHLNNQLNIELKEKTSEFESKIMLKQTAYLEAMKRISELEKKIENITSKNNELESIVDDRLPDIKNSESKLKSECDCINKNNNNQKNYIEELQNIVTNLQIENQGMKDQLGNYSILSSSEMDKTNADTSHLILNMETEKCQLEENLQLKCQELEDIRNDVQSLTTDIKKLEETIYLLTTENTEMATRLTTEQENAKQTELYLQKTIEELYARISEVTNEKITLDTDLATLNDQLNSMRSKMSVMYNEEQLFGSYQIKINKLTMENIELSTSITEKNKELENIKESKSLLYDHDCIYKEKIAIITEKNDYLLLENSELSTDLIDKIEENDMLKEQCNILKSKIEQLLTMNENVTGNDMEHLKMTNNTLNAEIAELKTKVTILSEENVKFSSNLLETIDNLDSSQNEKSCNNSLHLSKIFNSSTDVNETEQKIPQEETCETLINKVVTLENKIDHLVRLNKKLSDLKLTSCSQCVHLRNLNESRRALKFETKVLNQKLEDLQRKFDRKCADTEILKNKIDQELNSSEHDESLNITFVNEMNVSFVEARIESLNDELQTLKIDHDKLLVLYEDKCDELKQLQSDVIINATNPDDPTSRKSLDKTGNRIEQIQNCIDHLKNDMDKMKESSKNFTAVLNEVKTEKANLLNEINSLKDINEELQQKILNNESMALKKLQILENELTNMSGEIEQFSTREKGLETQRLMLEVELESLRVEEQNKNVLINQLNERVTSLKSELDLATKKELQHLRKQCEELEKEKIQCEELEQHNILKIKELEVCINDLQRNLTNQEYFYKEFQKKNVCLEKLLQEREQEKYILTEKLQIAESEIINFKNNFELKQQHQQHIKEYENNMQKLNDTLNKYINENLNLTQELANLRRTEEKFNEIMAEKECIFAQQKMLVCDNEKLNKELYDIKKCMLKELKSLKCDVDMSDFSSKSVNEIFKVLLQTLVSKEEEVIKTMQEVYERKQQKVEEEKQQCIDTEKRAVTWIKELEAEIEKLQTELLEQERAHKEYQNKISQLEHLLNESNHENEMFKEKIQSLDTDFNNLQNEFEKQCKVDSQQEEAIFIAQKREKEVQEIFKDKEVELQLKLKSESEMYEKKMNNLVQTIESYKSKNLMLNNTINELQVNEKQLKYIIEANSIEIKRNNKNVEKINVEFEQLKQSYTQINEELVHKNLRIEEMTAILKDKCDMLSEYTIKLKTIVPEYEMLKEHVNDQKVVIERCRKEIEILKKDREDQLEIIKEKLNSEEIKNARLSKQLSELNNKNVVLIEELNSLKEKYEDLQEANAKLERKIRNSTSKIKAEAEIEELKELNKRLQNNLEGASNRVTEFQEIKNQTLKDLVDVQGKYELVLQENNELRKSFSLYKSKYSNSSSWIDEGKYDVLLLEKNKIALELEDKKVMLNQKDKEVKEYVSQIQQLTNKNKELDEELEEYAAIIRERNTEISELEAKLYSRLSENVLINEAEGKLKGLNEENEKLRDQIEALKMRLQMNVEGDVKLQNENIIRALQKEYLELQMKLSIYEKQIDGNRLKEIDQLKRLDKTFENDLGGTSIMRVKELEGEKNRIVKELEAHKLLLNQKDEELKGYINKIQDLTTQNEELGNQLGEYATIIRSRDAEILKLETKLNLCSIENESDNNIKQQLESLIMENEKLKNEIKELQMISSNEIHSEKDIIKDSKRKQYNTIRSDRDINKYESKCNQLEKKIHELELQLVSKNGKIATLEIQIQSENFPYQRKCKELEEVVLAFRSKNAELSNEVRKLRKTVNDVNTWECDVCRRWYVNRKDQACQTIPNNAVRFCSTNSGVVEDHVKIQKLEKEKMLMKDLCRSRSRQIKELQDRIKELEEAQNSPTLRMHEILQDRSNQQDNNATKFKRHLDVGKNSKS